MRPSAPQTGSKIVELHIHGVLQVELRGLVLEEIMDLKHNKNSYIITRFSVRLGNYVSTGAIAV